LAQTGERTIRPGDCLKLVCEQEASLSKEYLVCHEGTINLPFLGRTLLAGLTLPEASTRIREGLLSQGVLEEATITLSLVAQPNRPVAYRGAVRFSGELPWADGLTLEDVLAVALPTDVADLSQVEIQSLTGESVRIDVAANPRTKLRPGDLVIFPIKLKQADVFVLGGVKKPGALEYREGLTVALAIEAAGGLSGQGDASRAELRRKGGEVFPADATSPLAVQPGDTVVVHLLSERRWVAVEGAVRKPGPVDFREGITLTQAVQEAGGLLLVQLDRAEIRRLEKGKVKTTIHRIDEVFRNSEADPKLQPGDRVRIVPRLRRR
jgi:polysaccharide export outer membrane protein